MSDFIHDFESLLWIELDELIVIELGNLRVETLEVIIPFIDLQAEVH